MDEGAILFIHDPKVTTEQIAIDLGRKPSEGDINNLNLNNSKNQGYWTSALNIDYAIKNADAAVILTEWQEYSQINWNLLSKEMRKPAWVFDARSIINPKDVIESGLNFWRIGDGLR